MEEEEDKEVLRMRQRKRKDRPRATQFTVDGRNLKRARDELMKLGPLPKTTTPYAKVANVVTTCKFFEEREEQRKRRESRRLRQTRASKATASIEDHTLDLVSIVRQLPAAKLDLSNFAALVCRMVDETTALIFWSGNMVTVRSLSPAQGIWSCHAYAHLINGMQQMYMPEGTDFDDWYPGCGYLPATPIMTTLKTRLCIKEVWRENIVAHGDLGCKIDLARMAIDNPHTTRYEPGSFPGAMWKAMVTDPITGQQKIVKNLVFHSGMWLIIGALHMRTVNEVFHRLRAVALRFENNRPEAPKADRSTYRLNHLWNSRFQPITTSDTDADDVPFAFRKKDDNPLVVPTQKLSEQLEEITQRLTVDRKKQQDAQKIRYGRRSRNKSIGEDTKAQVKQAEEEADKGYSLLMMAVERGNVTNVQVLLDAGEDPSYVTPNGVSALDLLQGKTEEIYDRIRVLILQYLIPKSMHKEAIGE